MSYEIKMAKAHLYIQKAYMPLLKDNMKEKHPAIYKFADKRWRKHGLKACYLLKSRLNKMEN